MLSAWQSVENAVLSSPSLLGLLAAYGIGWQVVAIDFSKASLDSRLCLSSVRCCKPDFIEPRREQNAIWVGVEVPCSPQPPQAYREDGGKSLAVMPDCGGVHETLIVTATGLWPNTDTNVVWRTPIGDPKMVGEDENSMLVVPADETGSTDHHHSRANHRTGCRA